MKGKDDEATETKYKNLNIRLSQWIANAKLILRELLEKDLESMVGFEYYHHNSNGMYGEGPISHRIVGKESKEGKRIKVQPFSGYKDLSYFEEINIEGVASSILNQFSPKYSRGVSYYKLKRDENGESRMEELSLVDTRNEIVKKIEKRTGVNLKDKVKNMF